MANTVAPNMFQLSGHHLHVTYTTTSITGQPTLTYQDPHLAKSFRGDDIRTVECDLGTLVSVTLRMTVDMGSTTFSLFIPRMQIAEGTDASMRTYGVTTLHSFSLIPQASHGQLDTYSVVKLRGTAQAVFF